MTSTEGLLLDAVIKSLGLEMITGHSIMLTCWRCGEQFCIVAHTVINKDMAFYTTCHLNHLLHTGKGQP
jgi:hypothetical protein